MSVRGLALFATVLLCGGCAGRTSFPAPTPPDPNLSTTDRRAIWEAILTLRRADARADSSPGVVPQVLLLNDGMRTTDSAQMYWLGSLFAESALVDGYCSKPSPCDCQRDALVPMEFLTLSEPRTWRKDTVQVFLGVAGTYPAWASGSHFSDQATWMIGLSSVQFYLTKQDASWRVIPTPFDPDRPLSLVGDGWCED